MRLLVVVDTFVPARISGALQMRDLVRELRAQGHRPTVVVPAPDLPRPWRIDDVDGVEVLRVRTMQAKDVGRVRRALAEWWLPYALGRGLAGSPLRDERWDGVVWYSPTIFFGPLVRSIKRRHRCAAYLILRDLFPDWAVDAGLLRKGIVYRAFKAVERAQYACADVIGVQARANVPIVAADAPAGARIEVLSNWLSAPTSTRPAADLALGPLRGRRLFVYAGNMGPAQDMPCLLDLAARLRQRTDVGFVFVGRGSELPRLQRIAAEQALDNVLFIDEIDAECIPALLAQCDVGLVALDIRHTTHNIPGKLLSYLHAGLPVLARINPGNDLEDMVRDEGIGFVATSEGGGGLEAFAVRLLDDADLRLRMGERGRALVARAFSPAVAVDQVLRGLAASRRPQVDTTASRWNPVT